jgi:hypothetical protein
VFGNGEPLFERFRRPVHRTVERVVEARNQLGQHNVIGREDAVFSIGR